MALRKTATDIGVYRYEDLQVVRAREHPVES